MTRLLLLVACLLFVTNASAQNKYIRVVGEGTTIEQAKENAFRAAVQQRAGAVVLSEQQSKFGKLDQDSVSMYSAGYVDDFKIVDITQNNSTIKITLDVQVAESKLLNQTLNTGKTNQSVNGDRAGAALDTFLDQKKKGDKLLATVLQTYPQNAFIITQQKFTLSVDSYRTATIHIPYSIKWNYNYIVAFNEAMSLLTDDRFGMFEVPTRTVVVMAKDPKDFLLGKKSTFKIADIPLVDRIKDSMTGDRAVRMSVVIYDNINNVIYKTCYIPDGVNGRKDPFYSLGESRSMVLFGNQVETGTMTAAIDPSYNYIIQKMNRIEVSVVPHSTCEK